MQLITQSVEILTPIDSKVIMSRIEAAGRTCYKSEASITPDSATEFIRMIIKRGHDSVLEHENISVRFITDRGVTHEIVRHRIASYSQESTRYCNYGNMDIKFILPTNFDLNEEDRTLLSLIEQHYKHCLSIGRTPQQARYFLPNGLKTEIVMTCNLREWRHFFKLRCAKAAHPQMRALAIKLYDKMNNVLPVIFNDLIEITL